MKSKYNLGRIIVIADKGLNSGSNLHIKEHNDGYIVAQQIRKRKQEIIDKVLDEDGYVYNFNHDFKIKSLDRRKQVKDKSGKVHILKEKVVCFEQRIWWSRKT